MLGKGVVVVSPRCLDKNEYDLYICDGHTNLPFCYMLVEKNKKFIISYHGIIRRENNLKKVYLATKSHLVSEVQFTNHDVEKSRYFVIPNYCEKIGKTKVTNNVGIVGRIDDPKKNVAEALSIAKLSDASEIHLWGGVESKPADGRIRYHSWSRNKEKIYNSFDVLISMSKEESMGLTVIEAMSCGIPCVLADIPGFQIYKGCPGIALVAFGDWDEAVKTVNDFLKEKSKLKAGLVEHWDKNYSEKAVSARWFREIEALLT